MLSEMLHHPPHHKRHTILHEALLTQLKQGCSKQLGVFGCYCSGSHYGYLDHLLHVFLNLHCCLVVLQGEEQRAAVRHWHYGQRGQRWSRHQVRHYWHSCPGGGRLSLPQRLKGVWCESGVGGVSVESIHAQPLQSGCQHALRGLCVLGAGRTRTRRAGCVCVATTNIRLPRNTFG